MSGWLYEGIVCFVAANPLGDHVPLYRAWNGSDHFYTTSKNEYDGLPSEYAREGIACYVAAGEHTGHKPLYRFYHKTKDDHIYTASENEKSNLEQDGAWRYEGIQCYVMAHSATMHVPFYRLYNPRIVDHFCTTSLGEVESATGTVIPAETDDVDLLVRTMNTHRSAPHYPIRLRGIAQKFHQDWSGQVGLIGLQEVKGKMTGCKTGRARTNGARCMAAELSSLFGVEAHGRYSTGNEVGLVIGGSWRIISKEHWELGRWLDRRYLIETLIEHKSAGYRLRFYSTHLSNTSKDKRSRQAKDVVAKVRERAKTGELPPIVVGDFNAGRNFVTGEAEDSVRKMEAHFWRPIDTLNLGPNPITGTGIDIIYIGKKSSFPNSRGLFRPVQRRHIPMAGIPASVVGHPEFTDELTDHHSEGFTFKIEGALPWVGENENVHVHEMTNNGGVGPMTEARDWSSGWTQAEPFTVGGSTFLFLLKEGNGHVHIHQLLPNGTVGPEVERHDWSSGWTTVSFFQTGGKTFLFLLKEGDGTVHIHQMNSNGSVGPRTDTRDWSSGWTQAEPFTVGGSTFLFLLKEGNGHVHIHQLLPNGTVGPEVERHDWSSGWTTVSLYYVGGSTWLFLLKESD